MRNTKLSIVIPAFNEAVRLPPSLHRIGTYLREDPTLLPAEVLVVDDGSEDGTAETAAAVRMPQGIDLKVFVYPHLVSTTVESDPVVGDRIAPVHLPLRVPKHHINVGARPFDLHVPATISELGEEVTVL